MASTVDWESWVFNFYYGEELRSLYMNGLLLAGFRPGIYNANILSYVDNSSNKYDFNLIIKRGTTLIFSNNYIEVNGKVERDFFGLGKETFITDDQFPYLIKCVANKDILITADALGDFGKQNNMGVDASDPKHSRDVHIFAKIYYSAKSNTSATINSWPDVSFEPYVYSDSGTSRRFISVNADTDVDVLPPDGMLYSDFKTECNRSSKLLKYSFLDLGVIRRSSPSAKLLPNNYVFTGHGLPEYRQSIVPGINILSPDFYVAHDLKTLHLDIPGISCDNVTYSYTEPNISEFIAKENVNTTPASSSNLLSTTITENLSIDDSNLILENLSGGRTFKYKYFVDFFYLHTNKKYSNLESFSSLEDVLKDPTVVGDKELKFDVRRFELAGPNNYCGSYPSETEKSEPYPYLEINSLDPGLDVEAKRDIRDTASADPSKKGLYTHYLYNLNNDGANLNIESSAQLIYGAVTPLDVSVANQQRLINLIKNKPILPKMIDCIRQEEDDATKYSTIIPVALAFRKYVKSSLENEGYWVGTFDDSTNKIDSANILSFFDLQFKDVKLHPVTIKESDVYNTLAVIE